MSFISGDDGRFDALAPGYEGVGEYYDLFADNSDIPFFLDAASDYGSPILDLAAGTGRIAFPLAQAGHEVVALERSSSMLDVAKKRFFTSSQEIRKRLTLVNGNMSDFDLKKEFALVIVPNSFGHALTTESQLSTLECVRRHLAKEGVFILDLFPGALQHEHFRFEDRPVILPNGSSVSRVGEMHMNPVRQLVRMDLIYTVREPSGSVIDTVTVTSGAAVIFNREADLLFRMANLRVFKEYGGFSKEPYREDSSRRIIILKRSD